MVCYGHRHLRGERLPWQKITSPQCGGFSGREAFLRAACYALRRTRRGMCKAAQALKAHGAERVLAYATHPVLSGAAIERIKASDLDELVVTDTIPLSDEARACDRIRVVSIASLLAETMRRISNEESVSSLFVD